MVDDFIDAIATNIFGNFIGGLGVFRMPRYLFRPKNTFEVKYRVSKQLKHKQTNKYIFNEKIKSNFLYLVSLRYFCDIIFKGLSIHLYHFS